MSQTLSAHLKAVCLMILVGILQSTAGVATRFLSPDLLQNHQWEMVFLRSGSCSLVVFLFITFWMKQNCLAELRRAGWVGLLSAVFWGAMASLFLIALSYTSVANVSLIIALTPLLAAILAHVILKTHVPLRTWTAIFVAWLGLAWMVGLGFASQDNINNRDFLGILIAFLIPVIAGSNLVLLQGWGRGRNMLPSVTLGGILASAFALLCMDGFHVTAKDVLILIALGVFQLGLPCALIIMAVRHLIAPEVALLGRLQVVLAPTWAWLFVGETPSPNSIVGGSLIIAALAGKEFLDFRDRIHPGTSHKIDS